jgi:DNA-binding transcriptional LysR family regulator
MDLNLLKVFDAIYAERHVTRAASRLLTSQSAVSHSLRNLRYIFRDPLFTRTPDGMSPTALADQLAERIGGILSEAQDVLSFRNDFEPASASGKITIGLLAPAPHWLVSELSRVLNEQAPNINLVFRELAVEQIAEVLDGRMAHLIIGGSDRVPDRRRLSHESLYEEPLVCLVGKANPLVGDTLDLETYAQLAHIAVATGTLERTFIDELLAKSGLQRRIRTLVPTPLLVGDLLANSDQICTLLPSLVLPDDRIRALPTPFKSKSMAMGQFYHSRDESNPQILWLRELMKTLCRHALGSMSGFPCPTGSEMEHPR